MTESFRIVYVRNYPRCQSVYAIPIHATVSTCTGTYYGLFTTGIAASFGTGESRMYNVGPDDCDCVTTGQLVELFCKSWGQGARWEDHSEPDAPHEANFLRLDCTKFKTMFQWKPRWHIQEAVAKTCEWTRVWLAKMMYLGKWIDKSRNTWSKMHGSKTDAIETLRRAQIDSRCGLPEDWFILFSLTPIPNVDLWITDGENRVLRRVAKRFVL